ncbi:MAG: hypothetical protein AAF355_06310 [Myxococcota bacterium]
MRVASISFVCALFVMSGFVPTAYTQEEEEENATTYDFEDDLVTGDLVRPDGELLNVRRRGRRSSLIRIREHFVPEMLKSVEGL